MDSLSGRDSIAKLELAPLPSELPQENVDVQTPLSVEKVYLRVFLFLFLHPVRLLFHLIRRQRRGLHTKQLLHVAEV